MIQAEDIKFTYGTTDKLATQKMSCWLCVNPITVESDPQYAIMDIRNHPYEYRSHLSCCFQLFGVFMLTTPHRITPEGDQLLVA